ncbi:MAG: hypothetical protein E7267_08515 [Lachnospiraceae bacterium]|nr:hypothetical protein [Lachnospiraceae bacterium]
MDFSVLFDIEPTLIIYIILVILTILFFILGIIKRKALKRISTLFFSLSTICCLPVAIYLMSIFIPKEQGFQTPNGMVYVPEDTYYEYIAALSARDHSTLRNILSEYPDLVYYVDNVHRGIMEYAMANCDIEMMQLSIDYGVSFDDPYIYVSSYYDSSCSIFFNSLGYHSEKRYTKGETTDEILAAVRFMLANGANMLREANATPPNFLFYAVHWITEDNNISLNDMNLIHTIIDAGCPTDATDKAGQTALEQLLSKAYYYDIDFDAFDLFNELYNNSLVLEPIH